MLFNSYAFLLAFAPLVYAVCYWLGARHRELAIAWVGLASLAFYAWWSPAFLLLLVPSIAVNYAIGVALTRRVAPGAGRSVLLAAGVSVNLLALFYFKYWTFSLTAIQDLTGLRFAVGTVVLPIGISFFTFTQIAFLVDAYRGYASEYRFGHYLFFVSFFPHLVAGPIIHHGEIMPQLKRPRALSFEPVIILLGIFIFTVGLSKKVLLADIMAPRASALFDAARDGTALTFVESWLAALLYGFQLYFDFSGYSDMAVGLSLMLGIRLPLNFNSPYKSTSIIDFWRRWHMTLSRFLRDYLYIPLGGNRHGPARRYLNLIITMTLGGLWHGASWNFLIWGVLHGTYLLVNHAWAGRGAGTAAKPSAAGKVAAGALTFLAVTFAWVFFRADGFNTALAMTRVMLTPFAASGAPFANHLVAPAEAAALVAIGAAIVWGFPNAMQITRRWHPVLNVPDPPRAWPEWAYWRPSTALSVSTAILLGVCIMRLSNATEFIYFNF